jgi:hypothetical protein
MKCENQGESEVFHRQDMVEQSFDGNGRLFCEVVKDFAGRTIERRMFKEDGSLSDCVQYEYQGEGRKAFRWRAYDAKGNLIMLYENGRRPVLYDP